MNAIRGAVGRFFELAYEVVTSKIFLFTIGFTALFWAFAAVLPYLQWYAFWRIISVIMIAGFLTVFARGLLEYIVEGRFTPEAFFYIGAWVFALGELLQAVWSLYARLTGQDDLIRTDISTFWIAIKTAGFVFMLAVPAMDDGQRIRSYGWGLLVAVFVLGAAVACALFFVAGPVFEKL